MAKNELLMTINVMVGAIIFVVSLIMLWLQRGENQHVEVRQKIRSIWSRFGLFGLFNLGISTLFLIFKNDSSLFALNIFPFFLISIGIANQYCYLCTGRDMAQLSITMNYNQQPFSIIILFLAGLFSLMGIFLLYQGLLLIVTGTIGSRYIPIFAGLFFLCFFIFIGISAFYLSTVRKQARTSKM
jgi:hypothetical protein